MSCTTKPVCFLERCEINVYELNNLEEYVYFRPLKTRLFKKYLSSGTFFASKLFFLSCVTVGRHGYSVRNSLIVPVQKPATPFNMGLK